MRTTPLYRVAVMGIASLAVAGLVGGCATKKTKSANAGSASTSSAAAAATSAAATSPSTAPSATATTVTATGGGKFCQQVASTINQAAARAAALGGSNNLAASIKETQAVEAAVIKAAPNSIKPDLITVFGATDKLYAALAKANYDYTKLDPTALTSLSSPEIKAAEQRLNDYAKNTCGIDIGAPDASSS